MEKDEIDEKHILRLLLDCKRRIQNEITEDLGLPDSKRYTVSRLVRRLESRKLLKRSYAIKRAQGGKECYIPQDKELARQVANTFLLSENPEDPVIYVKSKYHKKMGPQLLDDFLEEMGLKNIDSSFYNDFNESMLGALKYPSIVELIVSRRINDELIRAVIISNLGEKAINMDLESPLTEDKKMLGLMGIIITCRRYEAIRNPQIFIDDLKNVQTVIDELETVFENISKIIEENPELKRRILERREYLRKKK